MGPVTLNKVTSTPVVVSLTSSKPTNALVAPKHDCAGGPKVVRITRGKNAWIRALREI